MVFGASCEPNEKLMALKSEVCSMFGRIATAHPSGQVPLPTTGLEGPERFQLPM